MSFDAFCDKVRQEAYIRYNHGDQSVSQKKKKKSLSSNANKV